MGSGAEKAVRQGPRPKVLVVDDEEWMRDACGQILQAEGIEVLCATDGQTGLEMARRDGPDLVLVDLKMPGMNGIAFLEAVRAFDPYVAAVVITGYATLEVAVEAMKAGAYDFLPKPFKPVELRGVVRRGIAHRSAAQRASAILSGEAPASELHLAMLAHRFKEPLAVLRQCLTVVLQGYVGDVTARAKGMIEVAAQRADQMMSFVDDWLTLSRLEQAKGIQEARAVDLVELVNAAVQRAIQDPLTGKLTVQSVLSGQPGTIRADSTALEELLDNLLDNAVRYTPPGGSVTVEAAEAAGGAELTVRDTGPGIAPEEMERIFEPFYRGKAQKSIPGTGLGLPIVKRIAEAHGGRIAVESTPGQGAVFRVFLPRDGMKAPGAVPPRETGVSP